MGKYSDSDPKLVNLLSLAASVVEDLGMDIEMGIESHGGTRQEYSDLKKIKELDKIVNRAYKIAKSL